MSTKVIQNVDSASGPAFKRSLPYIGVSPHAWVGEDEPCKRLRLTLSEIVSDSRLDYELGTFFNIRITGKVRKSSQHNRPAHPSRGGQSQTQRQQAYPDEHGDGVEELHDQDVV